MTRALLMALIVASVALASVAPAHADPSERNDTDRVWNAAPFAVGAGVYLVLELGLKERLSRTECWWCVVNGLDTRARSAFKWESVERADQVSNLTGFIAAPALAIGGLVATTALDQQDSRRWFDDVVPVLQASIVAGAFNQTFKLLFSRKRPFAHFKGRSTQKRAGDENASFFSGHTSLAFALATSAGTVATLRDYGTAPVLWGGGLLLAVTTAYLRIGADAHYATDVLCGALVGSAIGVAIPLLFHRDVLTDEPAAPRVRAHTNPMIFSVGSRF